MWGKSPPAVCEVIFPHTICKDSSGLCHFVWGKRSPYSCEVIFPHIICGDSSRLRHFVWGKSPLAVCKVIFPHTICEDLSGLRYFVWRKSPLQLRSQFPLYIFHHICPTASEYVGETESNRSGKSNLTSSNYLASNKIGCISPRDDIYY